MGFFQANREEIVSAVVAMQWLRLEAVWNVGSDESFDSMVKNIKKLVLEPLLIETKCEEGEEVFYRSFIANLLYLSAHTRTDIRVAEGTLSTFVECPTTVHLMAERCRDLHPQESQETGMAMCIATSRSRMQNGNVKGMSVYNKSNCLTILRPGSLQVAILFNTIVEWSHDF